MCEVPCGVWRGGPDRAGAEDWVFPRGEHEVYVYLDHVAGVGCRGVQVRRAELR